MADMSFLPEDYLDKRAQRRTNFICMTLFVVIIAALGGAWVMSERRLTQEQSQLDAVNHRINDAAVRIEQMGELQKRRDQMVKKARVTGALLEKLPRSLILSQLVNAMPTTLSLLEVELETTALKPTGPAPKTALDKAKADAKGKKPAPAKKGEKGKDPEPEIEVKPMQIKLIITGVAKTDVEVSQFMADIKNTPLFSNVNLGFSEEVKLNDVPMRKFKVEIVVNQDIDFRKFEPVLVKRDLKQNPMGKTINIDENGQVVPRAPHSELIKNASDNPRRNLK
jgi:Tfp pilus assembly protein PilN